MKINGGKINSLGVDLNTQQIKVNKKVSKNLNINKIQINPNYYSNYNSNRNEFANNENKNVKYQSNLDLDSYSNNSVYTEYDSLQKYSINPSNIYGFRRNQTNDVKTLYNNTNANINDANKLIEKIQSNHNRLTFNNAKKNFTEREAGKHKKMASYKGSKRFNLLNNPNINIDNMKTNFSISLINPRSSFQRGTKLSISKSEVQYPMDFYSNIPRNRSKYKSNNITFATEGNIEEEVNINSSSQNRRTSKNEKVGNYNISSPRSNFSSKKKMRQNKSNLGFLNRRKNNEIRSDNIQINHISGMKSSNFCSKTNLIKDNDLFNSNNSCSNFYQRENINLNPNNYKGKKVLNTMNNFRYANSVNYTEGNNNNKCPYYGNITNHEIYEDENGISYINIIEHDFKKKNSFKNKRKKMMNINDNNSDINLNSDGKIKITNILSLNKILSYEKQLMEDFCYCLEEFMFENVKHNFDNFISKLKEYGKEKYYNELVFKRIQNNHAKKNYNKERALSYKLFEDNNSNLPLYSSNFVDKNNKNNKTTDKNGKRLGIYSSNDLSKEYIEKKKINNYNKKCAPLMNSQRVTKKIRDGKNSEIISKKNSIDKYSSCSSYYINKNNTNLNKDKNKEKLRTSSNEKYKTSTNLYVPKKLKKNNDKNISYSKTNEKQKRKKINLNTFFYILDPNKKNNKISKVINTDTDTNKSLDLNDEMIKEKIKKNFIKKQLKNCITTKSQDVSYDNKIKINKEIENGLLNNKTGNDLSILSNINSGTKLNKPVYKKKIKISQKKSNIFQNKKLQINKSNINKLNINDKKTASKILSNQNLNKKSIKSKNLNEHHKVVNLSSNDLNKLKQIKLKNIANMPNKQNIKNEKINKANNNINNENKSDINLNIKKEINSLNISEDNKQINENSSNMVTRGKLSIDRTTEKNIDNGNIVESEKNIEENNIGMSDINKDKDKDNNEIIDINSINSNNYNGMSNGKHNMNEDTDESDENIIKEIIVKDVSTSDKRLNVFIKYIELLKYKNKSDKFVQHMLNSFQTDCFYFPASKPKNYYYHNQSKNNKLQKILSSIMEEEEKSKAAGSVNNSVISEEEIYKNGNYSHFFIQSVKYVTNFLQSVINDKKKDLAFQFFKILKRIKNEAFLKGLMSQKNFQSVSKLKDDEENENNTSGEIILYNVNDNFNVDINYFGSKSNDRKDISDLRNKNSKKQIEKKQNNKNNDIKENKDSSNINLEGDEDNIISIDKKYSSATNFYLPKDEDLIVNKKSLNLSMDNYKENEQNKNENNETEKKNKKLKKIIKHIDKYNKLNIISKYFKQWEEFKDEINDESDINLDSEKNISISEAYRGLSDVIFDFKIYLVKFSLKNKVKSQYE